MQAASVARKLISALNVNNLGDKRQRIHARDSKRGGREVKEHRKEAQHFWLLMKLLDTVPLIDVKSFMFPSERPVITDFAKKFPLTFYTDVLCIS